MRRCDRVAPRGRALRDGGRRDGASRGVADLAAPAGGGPPRDLCGMLRGPGARSGVADDVGQPAARERRDVRGRGGAGVRTRAGRGHGTEVSRELEPRFVRANADAERLTPAPPRRRISPPDRPSHVRRNPWRLRTALDPPPRSRPDITRMLHNWPHLYAGGLADVSDLAEWKAGEQGDYYPHSGGAARLGKRWLALPYFTGAPLIAYRKSWFADVGANQPPRTLEEYKKIGVAMKKKGKPVGQTLGHTFGDAPAWTYPFTWSFGGAETDASGKKVVLNSTGTVEAVKWMTDFWKVACDESALAWDDTNNNRAFHAGEISATLNGASIYIYAKRNPDKIKDERGEPMWRDISHFPIPDSPARRPPPHT